MTAIEEALSVWQRAGYHVAQQCVTFGGRSHFTCRIWSKSYPGIGAPHSWESGQAFGEGVSADVAAIAALRKAAQTWEGVV